MFYQQHLVMVGNRAFDDPQRRPQSRSKTATSGAWHTGTRNIQSAWVDPVG
jgi:hypothetical protein